MLIIKKKDQFSINSNLNNIIEKKNNYIHLMLAQQQSQPNQRTRNLNKTISTFFSLRRAHPKSYNLGQLESRTDLMKNSKYRQFVSYLRSYNKKLEQSLDLQICATDEKLHQFLYTSLCICCSKTESEAKQYLEEIDKWYQNYSYKRKFMIQCRHKVKIPIDEEQNIRQTYKSNLPSEIQNYSRHLFTISPQKIKEKFEQVKKKLGFSVLEDDDNDFDSVRSLDSDEEEKKKNQKEIVLPNLRNYKMEILRMKKAIQDKQDVKMLEKIKKNKARIQAQTVNGFYKPFPNFTGVMTKPLKSLNKENVDSTNFYNTSLGFQEIKKKKLNTTMGLRSLFKQSEMQNVKETIDNVDGFTLIKNPFEIMKKQKNKKKK